MCYPPYKYGLEMTALTVTEKQQGNGQVGKNKWIRRIAGEKRADKKRMDKLRVAVGVKESLKKKLVRSRWGRSSGKNGRWQKWQKGQMDRK